MQNETPTTRRPAITLSCTIAGALLAGTVFGACEDQAPTSNAGPARVPPLKQRMNVESLVIDGPAGLQGDAHSQILKALQGRRLRGGQDDMLRVEAVAAGFAGYYLDANERVVLLQKPTVGISAAAIRQLVYDLYADSPDNVARVLMSTAKEAEIRDAQFSLSALVAIEQAVLARSREIPGFVGDGAVVPRNVVELGIADESSVPGALSVTRSLGIPDSALAFNVMGRIGTTGAWGDIHRPTFGGIKLEFYDGRYDYRLGPDSVFVLDGASHGYNVRLDSQPSQPTRMLTAAHTVNEYTATNGYTGLPVFQVWCWTPTTPGLACNTRAATVSTNPPWSASGCSAGYDYCTFADVAAATFASGVSGTRGVGTSTTQGNDGNAGTNAINGVYAISGVITPAMVPIGRRNVFKSGYNTGTTAGTINTSFWNMSDTALVWGNPKTSTVRKKALFLSQVRVDSIGFGYGDSGAPVFVRISSGGVCTEYCALGLESSGGPAPTGTYARCAAGTGCYIGVSP